MLADLRCRAEPGLECLAVLAPGMFGTFRAWCALDDSTDEGRARRRHVLARSRLAFSSADELRKVLMPVSGGAGGGCACNCGVICSSCAAGPFVSGTSVAVSTGGTTLWTQTYTSAPSGFCSPAMFVAGTYTVTTAVPGFTPATDTVTVGSGSCTTTNAPGLITRPPLLDNLAGLSFSAAHAAGSRSVTATGIGPSPDVALGAGTLTVTASSSVIVDVGATVTYTSPNPTATILVTWDGFFTGVITISVNVQQSNITNTGCSPKTKTSAFTVTLT